MPDENQEPKERKTPDDRAKLTELERIRHSCAHVLTTARVALTTADGRKWTQIGNLQCIRQRLDESLVPVAHRKKSASICG